MLRDVLPFNFIDLQLNTRKRLGICSVLLTLSRSKNRKRVKWKLCTKISLYRNAINGYLDKLVYTEMLLMIILIQVHFNQIASGLI